jgi:carbohydrate-selective porin OprB
MSNRVGSISGLNANTVPDGAAVDEFYWRHGSADGRWILLAGRIDQSDYFDANRAANDGFGQFLAFAFENNLSIPWSTYGSFGGLLRVQLKKRRYLLASIGAAGNEDPRIPWSAEGQDGWNQVIEFGAAYDLAGLGRGHIRVTPWHSRVPGASGFGLALNLDQALGTPRWGAGPTGPGRSASGPMVGFFRAGVGEPAVTPVQTFVSAGAVLQQPFGRARDALGLGFAWSKPSPGAGQRSEGLIETYYRFALSPAVSLTPDLQIVINPAQDSDATTVAVLGLRLHLKL